MYTVLKTIFFLYYLYCYKLLFFYLDVVDIVTRFGRIFREASFIWKDLSNECSIMILGTLLLVILLLECFSLKSISKVKVVDRARLTAQGHCKSSDWIVASDKATICSSNIISSKKNCTVVSGLYDLRKVNELFVSVCTDTRKINKTDKVVRRKFILLALYGSSQNPDEAYTTLVSILPNSVFNTVGDFFQTVDIISFSRNQSYSQVSLGLQDSSYCGTVKSISLFYYMCPANTAQLVDFTEEAAPNKTARQKKFIGKCTTNAVKKSSSLSMICYFNGTFEVFGSCECRAGFMNRKNKCEG